MPQASAGANITDPNQLNPDVVRTGHIKDGEIVNADIKTTAAIARSKLANVSATSRAIGRKSAGAGADEELTLSELLDFIGSAAHGDVLFRGAANWERLAIGANGTVLKSAGAGANPAWGTFLVNENAGTVQKDMTDASGSQNIAHGLDHTPTYIKIYAVWMGSSGIHVMSYGTKIGSTVKTIVGVAATSALATVNWAIDTTNIINIECDSTDSGDKQVATVTADGTNITLAWTKTASPTSYIILHWEAH